MFQGHPDEPRDEEFLKKMSDFENEARKIGLYVDGFMVAEGHLQHDPSQPPTPDDQTNGKQVVVNFFVGEQAFDNRVLEPEKHEEDTTFRTLTAGADPFEVLKEEMRKKREEGKGPFDE